jgi:tetratricopeptide (TPR) repeat protein
MEPTMDRSAPSRELAVSRLFARSQRWRARSVAVTLSMWCALASLLSSPLVLSSAASLVAMAAARSAAAQSAPAPSTEVAEARARAHFQRGQELANQGKYPQAYLEFEAGYRQSRRPLFLFNLGESARAFGDAGRARAAYQRYLEEDPQGPMVEAARRRLTDLGDGPATDLGLPKRKDDAAPAPAPAPQPVALPPERFAPPPRVEARPLWKKWPFWVAVGGAVAGGVAIYAFTRDTSACGDGCTLVDLR